MNHSFINASVSMRAFQQKLDLISNNVANVNTVGFKKRDATFEDLLTNIKQQPEGFRREGRLSPLGLTQSWGAKLSQAQLNLSQGTLQSTGLSTDLALEGSGLFEIRTNLTDENGQPINGYTRNGNFQLAVDANDPNSLFLATQDGNPVVGAGNVPIRVPVGYKVVIDDIGNVSAYKDGESAATAQLIGRLSLVRVVRPQYLEQLGENMFRLLPGADNTGNAIIKPIDQSSPLEERVAVRQGFLEQANVNLGDEMTDLMMTQRAFQLSSRALTNADTMMNLANNLRGT